MVNRANYQEGLIVQTNNYWSARHHIKAHAAVWATRPWSNLLSCRAYSVMTAPHFVHVNSCLCSVPLVLIISHRCSV